MSLLRTMLVGIAGSLVAAADLLRESRTNAAPAGSIARGDYVSTGIVYADPRSRGGTLTQPAPADRLGRGPLAR